MLYRQASDDDLIYALIEGKEDALAEIFKRHWRSLYDEIFAKMQSHELAEEIVQQVFTALWDDRSTLVIKPLEPFHLLSYLGNEVKNKILQHIEKGIQCENRLSPPNINALQSAGPSHEQADYNALQKQIKFSH